MTGTTTIIKLGDYVTWQNRVRQKIKPITMPPKITGCKVIELFDVDGKAAAKIDCGRLFGSVIAYVADLDLEERGSTLYPQSTILSGG